jgi:hypothetical protein
MVPPEKEIDPALMLGENVGEPQPEVETPVGFATTIFPGEVGKVSLKATPVNATLWLGLVIVRVSVEVAPARMGDGENDLAILGDWRAVKDAVAIPVESVLVPPLVDEI